MLYRAHYQALARIAVLLVSDTAAAGEIVESAFVSLHRAWRYLGDEDKALAYLRAAVVSGTRSRDAAPTDSPSRPSGAPHASGPDSTPGTLLVAALQAIPPRQREALVLKYYAQWPDAQIATAMGISGRAVGRHTDRGISTLRACGVLD